MVYRLNKKGKGLFANGQFASTGGGKDTGGGGMIGNNIHIFGGTDNATVFNDHFKSTDGGVSFTQLSLAPWTARNEFGYVSVNGKIYMWAGINSVGTGLVDSWQYDETNGWSQITTSMTGFTSSRKLFSFLYKDGFFYSFAGSQSQSIRSSDLITWSVIGTIPADLTTGPSSACVFKGDIYIVGGSASSGNLYKSTDNGVTFTSILTDVNKFKTDWASLQACDNVMILTKGHNGTNSNMQGTFITEDGLNWTELPVSYYQTHGPVSFASLDNTKIIMANGNDWKASCWMLERVDN